MTPLIDAHHHLWAPQSEPDTVGWVWLRDIGAPKPFGDPTPIQRDYLLDEFREEPAPATLRGSVHVQADPKLPDPVAETAFVQRLADAAGFEIRIVGFVDLAGGAVEELLIRHREYPGFCGVRQIIAHLPDRPDLSFAATNLLDDLAWRAGFATLADHGLRFDLQLYPPQMQQAADFLSDHPGIPVVIDHLGSPYDHSAAGLAQWRAGMAALAALPQVHVKLSGYAMYFRADPGALAQDLTQQALALFGPERCMFGSNFPVDRLYLTYGALHDFVAREAGDAGATVFHDTAARFYGFDGP